MGSVVLIAFAGRFVIVRSNRAGSRFWHLGMMVGSVILLTFLPAMTVRLWVDNVLGAPRGLRSSAHAVISSPRRRPSKTLEGTG